MASGEDLIDFPAFLASITHDMKNSLGMLLNTLDEAVSICDPESCPSYRFLSQMQYEAKRVNNNLIQLLTLYKMDRAQYVLNISQYAVDDVIEETVLQNRPLLDFKGIEILTECPEELSWFLDRDLISGVINNVLNNAYRYARDKIKIRASEEGGFLSISIEDNGTGYPDHLLQSDTQTRKGVNFQSGSTGLGLFFASCVARMHRNRGKEGSVSIRNGGEFGGGCFTIILP